MTAEESGHTSREWTGGGLKGVEEEGTPTVTQHHHRTINNQRIDGSRVLSCHFNRIWTKKDSNIKTCLGRAAALDLKVSLSKRVT